MIKKKINLETASIEELKSAFYDNARQIAYINKQNAILEQAIMKKEQIKNQEPKEEKK
jgi:hypothetical protein